MKDFFKKLFKDGSIIEAILLTMVVILAGILIARWFLSAF